MKEVGLIHETECMALEANIRWAEAFIIVYSVTDKCSFDECNRLKFLINYNKRRRRLGGGLKDSSCDVPVVLVGNKTDQIDDRMVSLEEGQRRSKEIGCVCFHEISVRESIEQVFSVFHDVCRFWRWHNKCPSKIKKSGNDKDPLSPDTGQLPRSISPANSMPSTSKSSGIFGRRWTEIEIGEEQEEAEGETSSKASTSSSPSDTTIPFRERASTDGHLLQRPWKWRYPPPGATESNPEIYYSRSSRRMSISMKGNNASY